MFSCGLLCNGHKINILNLWEIHARAVSLFVRYTLPMFDPDAHIPRPNRSLIYFGACIIAGLRLARETHVNIRVIPTSNAISESIELSHEIFNRVFRRVPDKMTSKHGVQ